MALTCVSLAVAYSQKLRLKETLMFQLLFACQGLRHADENGGGGDADQAAAKPGFSSEGNPYQKPKTQRIWPTIFLKMGGIIPRTLKLGGTRPPVPPCGGAPVAC